MRGGWRWSICLQMARQRLFQSIVSQLAVLISMRTVFIYLHSCGTTSKHLVAFVEDSGLLQVPPLIRRLLSHIPRQQHIPHQCPRPNTIRHPRRTPPKPSTFLYHVHLLSAVTVTSEGDGDLDGGVLSDVVHAELDGVEEARGIGEDLEGVGFPVEMGDCSVIADVMV